MNKLPEDEDFRIGRTIRILRLKRRMSQTELGDAIGVSYQQIQKYESGLNRIGGSRLARLAQALGVKPAFFFDEVQTEGIAGIGDLLKDERNIRALLALSRISDDGVKDSLVRFIEQVASGNSACRRG